MTAPVSVQVVEQATNVTVNDGTPNSIVVTDHIADKVTVIEAKNQVTVVPEKTDVTVVFNGARGPIWANVNDFDQSAILNLLHGAIDQGKLDGVLSLKIDETASGLVTAQENLAQAIADLAVEGARTDQIVIDVNELENTITQTVTSVDSTEEDVIALQSRMTQTEDDIVLAVAELTETTGNVNAAQIDIASNQVRMDVVESNTNTMSASMSLMQDSWTIRIQEDGEGGLYTTGAGMMLYPSWTLDTDYVKEIEGTSVADFVWYLGEVYECIVDHTSSTGILPTNTSYWQLIPGGTRSAFGMTVDSFYIKSAGYPDLIPFALSTRGGQPMIGMSGTVILDGTMYASALIAGEVITNSFKSKTWDTLQPGEAGWFFDTDSGVATMRNMDIIFSYDDLQNQPDIGGEARTELQADIDDAALNSVWDNIIGSGKPADNADVTDYLSIDANALSKTGFSGEITWHFSNTFDGWSFANGTRIIQPNSLRLEVTATDPQFTSPSISVDGAVHNKVRMRLRRISGTAGWDGSLYYETDSHGYSASFRKINSNDNVFEDWHVVEWDLENLTYGGTDWIDNTIKRIRIDIVQNPGDVWEVDWVAVGFNGVADATNYPAIEADAQARADAVQDYADAQDEVYRIAEEARVDGVIAASEAASLAAAQAYADLKKTEMLAYADGEITASETALIAAYQAYADAAEAAAVVTANAYADGEVSAEEARAIADATAKANAAQSAAEATASADATNKADAAQSAAESAAATYTDTNALPIGIAIGGLLTTDFIINNAGGTANGGEVYFTDASFDFVHPNGYTKSLGASTITTDLEGGNIKEYFLMFGGSDTTRFTGGGISNTNIIPVHKEGNIWYCHGNLTSEVYEFTPNENDCILAKIWKHTSTPAEIQGICRYASKDLATQAYTDAAQAAAETTAAAYADGIVTIAEAAAIASANAYADARKVEANAYSDGVADQAELDAIASANTYADAVQTAAETTAAAYADGIVSAEETRAIADATAKADAAKLEAMRQGGFPDEPGIFSSMSAISPRVVMSLNDIAYGVFEDGTNIYRNGTLILEDLDALSVGTLSGHTYGDIIESNKPVTLVSEDGYALPALCHAGKNFLLACRTPSSVVIRIYTEKQATIVIEDENGFAAAITEWGDSDTGSVSPGFTQVTADRSIANISENIKITSDVPILIQAVTTVGEDNTAPFPASRERLMGKANPARETFAGAAITIDPTGFYLHSTGIFGAALNGDGAGSDGEAGIPPICCGDSYMLPHLLKDFMIVSVEPAIIKIFNIWDGSLYTTVDHSAASRSNVLTYSEGNQNGANANTTISVSGFLFLGSNTFCLRTNVNEREYTAKGFNSQLKAGYNPSVETLAKAASEAYTDAERVLAETTAAAYADGIVSVEETRAIADAQAKADAAEAAAQAYTEGWSSQGADVTAEEQFAPKELWNFDATIPDLTPTACTITQMAGYIKLNATGDNLWITKGQLSIVGAENTIVRARVRVHSYNNAWDGSIFYVTSGHGTTVGYKKNIPPPANFVLGEWITLEWDMADLTAGGTDWVDSVITAVRFDIVNGDTSELDFDWAAVGRKIPSAVYDADVTDYDAIEVDAQSRADAAQTAAAAYTDAERVLAEATAAAYTDGEITASEAASLAAAQAYADTKKAEAQAYADGEITASEAATLTAYQAYADAAEAAAVVTANAYADGEVSAEEARAIQDATDKAEAARIAAEAAAATDATTKADAAQAAAESAAADNTTAKIRDIELGGSNLLLNTRDVTGYPNRTEDTYLGFAVMSVTVTGGYIDIFNKYTIDIPTGDTYTVSFYARSADVDKLRCYYYSPNTTLSGESSTGQISAGGDGGTDVDITTEWKRYWVTWTQSETSELKKVLIRLIQVGTLEVAGVKFEKGNKASDWTPAPEDVEANTTAQIAPIIAVPAAPTISSIVENADATLNLTITPQSGDGATRYELYNSIGDETDYALIATLPVDEYTPPNFVVRDATFDRKTTIYYKAFAVNRDMYSLPSTDNFAVGYDIPDPGNVTVSADLNSFTLNWTNPDNQLLDHVEVRVEARSTNSGFTEAAATLIYSGSGTSFTYQVPPGDQLFYHQFWLTSVEKS